jgi:NAD-dependent DNA ligase
LLSIYLLFFSSTILLRFSRTTLDGKNKKKSKAKTAAVPKLPKVLKLKPILAGAELLEIDGIGEKAVDALLGFARDSHSRDLVEGLLRELTILPNTVVKKAKSTTKRLPSKKSKINGANSEADGGDLNMAITTADGSIESKTAPEPDDVVTPTAGSPSPQNSVALTSLWSLSSSSSQPPSLALSLSLQGKTVVFTGRLHEMTRSRAQEICEQLGTVTADCSRYTFKSLLRLLL